MPISEVVHVAISAQDKSVAQASFNKILLAGYHTAWPELIRDYDDPDQFNVDFASWPAMLAMGNAFFSQNPRPESVAVGRLTVATTKTFDVYPVAANTTPYNLQFNGDVSLTASYTSDGTASVPEIVTNLTTQINGLSIAGLTATDNTTKVTISATAGTWFSILSTGSGTLNLQEMTANPSTHISTQLANIALERNDWYGVDVQDHSKAILEDVAAYVETQPRLVFLTSSCDYDVKSSSTTDTGSALKGFTYNRTHLDFHPDSGSFEGVRLMSELFPFTGVQNRSAQFQSLAGLSVVPVNSNDVTNLKGKNVGVYRVLGGINLTYGNKMASGRYIDVEIGIDWLTARMEERVFGRLAQGDGVPYTDAGLAQLESLVRAQLREAIGIGLIADDDNLSVTITKVADQSPNDRASRIVRGVKFRGRLAGFAEEIFVNGTVFP